jgi:dihydroorotase
MSQTVQANDAGKVLYGYDHANKKYVFPEPSNFHTHFRTPDDPRFPVAVEAAARLYRYVTAMPNLGKDRLINTPERAIAYREAIHEYGRKWNPTFEANVPLYMEPETNPKTVQAGYEQKAWIAAKIYSKGATTQSAEGVDFRALKALYPVFGFMQEAGMIALLHVEPVLDEYGDDIDPFDRESEGLHYVQRLLRDFPKLKIVFEHVSSEAGTAFVRSHRDDGHPIEATVAPQYLVWNRSRLFSGGMNPEYFSIPVLKRERDREALVKFVMDGYGFLGTDSAPHLKNAKARLCGCAGGVFNEPVGLYVYFNVFKDEGERQDIDDWFDRFVGFASIRGPAFYESAYGENMFVSTAELREEVWTVRERFIEGENPLTPMWAGETMSHRLYRSE